jgi:hypothetical protein
LRPCLRCGFVSDGLMPWAIMIGPTPHFPFYIALPLFSLSWRAQSSLYPSSASDILFVSHKWIGNEQNWVKYLEL